MPKFKFLLALVLLAALFSLVPGVVLAQGPSSFEVQNLIRQLADGQTTLEQLTDDEQLAVRQYIETTPTQVTFQLTPEVGQIRLLSFDSCNTIRAEATLNLPLPLVGHNVPLGTHSQRVNWCYDNPIISSIGRADPQVDTAFFIEKGDVYTAESGGEGQSYYRTSSEVELRFCLPVRFQRGRIGIQLPCLEKAFPPLWVEVRGTGAYFSNGDMPAQAVGECWRYTGGWLKLLQEETSLPECISTVKNLANTLPRAGDGYTYIRFWQGPQGVENHWIAVSGTGQIWTKLDGQSWQLWP